MQTPPAGLIEAAADSLSSYSPHQLAEQIIELMALGDPAIKLTGATTSDANFIAGYQLGLATARIMLQQSTLLTLKEIDPKQLL